MPQPPLPAGAVRRGPAKAGLGRFTLGNIEVHHLAGNGRHAAVIAFSLLAINRQQQDLALRNSLSLEPCSAEAIAVVRTWRVQTKASRPCVPWNRSSNARLCSGLSWCGTPCRSPRGA